MLPAKSQEKFDTLKIAADTMPRICAHVANGGSMIDLCELWAVPYGHVLEWINASDARFQLYQKSLNAQMYWAIDRILKELKALGTVDIGEIFDEHGGLKKMADIPADVRRCIAGVESIEVFEGVGKDREYIGDLKKIKMYDKIRALELMGKKFAMFIDRAQVDLTNKSLEDLIAESMRPAPIDVTPGPDDSAGKNVAMQKSEPQTTTPGEAGGVAHSEGPIPPALQKNDENPSVAGSQPPSPDPQIYHGKE